MRMLIFGHGYSAAALTPRLIGAGWTVAGTTRNDAQRVARSGAVPILWPGEEGWIRDEIASADAILISVAPDAAPSPAGGIDPLAISPDPVIAAFTPQLLAARPGWVGYLSSTNVYGDHGGDWVDETTPPNPGSPRARARLRAEEDWTDLSRRAGWPLTIFRLAGIYGPDRGPFAKLRAGTARRIVKPGQVFSRIHVEDIAGALLASLNQSFPRDGMVGDLDETRPGDVLPSQGAEIINLCDDDPAPPEQIIEKASRMLGLPPPPVEDYETAPMTPMARSFYADSKRVRNERMKQKLGYRLRYPDAETGLSALLAEE